MKYNQKIFKYICYIYDILNLGGRHYEIYTHKKCHVLFTIVYFFHAKWQKIKIWIWRPIFFLKIYLPELLPSLRKNTVMKLYNFMMRPVKFYFDKILEIFVHWAMLQQLSIRWLLNLWTMPIFFFHSLREKFLGKLLQHHVIPPIKSYFGFINCGKWIFL